MVDKKEFIKIAMKSYVNIFHYASFVSGAEYLTQCYPTWFIDDYDKYTYNRIWMEMEIINALALDEWEMDGYPNPWIKWDSTYKEKAKKQ